MYDQLAQGLTNTLYAILREGWYTYWAEWWHMGDILTHTTRAVDPNRRDTSTATWHSVIQEVVIARDQANGLALVCPTFSLPSAPPSPLPPFRPPLITPRLPAEDEDVPFFRFLFTH